MTLSKLSLRNACRQARDYLVYFATVAMAVALIYAFNALIFTPEVRQLSSLMDNLPLVIGLASLVVVCVIGWLVSYTTRFMLIRRSREMGLYLLIGLENGQIARMFLLENLLVGVAALALGLLLGSLLFQALWAIVLALFHLPYRFGFTLSPEAARLTLAYFALIYAFAQFKNRKRIRKMNIYDLLHFERQNEEAALKTSRLRRRLFTASIVLGVAGTFLLMQWNLILGILGAGCIIAFLYGFFASFSSGVPAWFETHTARKYQGQALLVFRGLSAKISTMGVVMATIALLFTATLLTEGSGLVFRAILQNRSERNCCFDLLVSADASGTREFAEAVTYARQNFPIWADREYQIYLAETSEVTDFIESRIAYYRFYARDTLMRWSDYTALREQLGYEPVTLEPGQYRIHCEPYVAAAMRGWQQPLTLGGETLFPGGVSTEVFAQYLYNVNGQGFLLVVPDEIAEACPASHSIYAALVEDGLSMEQYQGMCSRLEHVSQQTAGSRIGGDIGLILYSKAAEQAEAASMIAMTVFPLFYLALVLTMTAAAILTMQQLSESERYRQQFALLRKLGMDEREMAKALRTQLAVFYSLPAFPPVLIAVPFLMKMGKMTEPGILTGASSPAIISSVALTLFFLIYGIYILLAYTSLKRGVLPETL